MREAPLVTTKLYRPTPRPGAIERGALSERVGERRLTLVSAPPGAGKTSLLAEWVASRRVPIAWLGVDAADNDAVRFVRGVTQALATVEPGVAEGPLSALTGGPAAVEVALTLLVNELAARDEPIALVLDDYHLIQEQTVHDAVAFVLDHSPPALRVVMATRVDPPLPLWRWRARDELVELRTQELRFSEEEAERLLNGTLGIGIAGADVGRLCRRTEGWAAGLYLAGLSLAGREDVTGAIDSFAGDDRNVADFLVGEVLDRQAPDVRGFLVETSVLGRLSGDVCDAVTGGEGGDEILARLERSNLFVVPLDQRRRWFRYHHLFADLLQSELRRTAPGREAELHRRAASWHATQGDVAEAIEHALTAGDASTAAELIAAAWWERVQAGTYATVEGWLDALPDQLVRSDARLAFARAWVYGMAGRPAEAEEWVAAAEAGRHEGSLPDGSHTLAGAAAVLRGGLAALRGDAERCIAAARRALEAEPPESPTHGLALSVLGAGLLMAGDLEAARGPLEASIAPTVAHGAANAAVTSLGFLAQVQAATDGPRAALETAERGLRISEEHRIAQQWTTGLCLTERAWACLSLGRFAEAAADAERAVTLVGSGHGPVVLARALIALGRARHALGESDEARAALAEASDLLSGGPGAGPLGAALAQAEKAVDRRSSRARHDRDELSERERAVLRLLATDLSLREIGNELYVSHNTIKTHVKAIYRKLGATNRDDAVARARAEGYL